MPHRYICEEGLVHYCSQQRGYPGTPLSEYTQADIDREYNTEKWCAPFCTVACAHKVSILDNWRNPQRPAGVAATAEKPDAVGEMLRVE